MSLLENKLKIKWQNTKRAVVKPYLRQATARFSADLKPDQ